MEFKQISVQAKGAKQCHRYFVNGGGGGNSLYGIRILKSGRSVNPHKRPEQVATPEPLKMEGLMSPPIVVPTDPVKSSSPQF